MIRSLAFGERDWITLSAILFFLSDTQDFVTVPGILCFVLGVMLLGPIFGMMIYLTSKIIYLRLKAGKKLPRTPLGLKQITWAANALCFPAIWFLSWQTFKLFYESYDSLIPQFCRVSNDAAQSLFHPVCGLI